MKLIPATVASIMLAIPAFAQEASPDPLLKETVTIAAGAAYIPSYVGSNDYVVVPALAARGSIARYHFTFDGTQARVDLIRERDPHALDLQLGPVAGLNLSRTSRIQDPRVRALGKLDTAVELGGYVGIGKTGVITSPYDTLSATLTYVHDVAGAHGSYRLVPAITYGTPLSRKAYVLISGYTDLIGRRYGDYYFSVTPQGAAASALPAYSARRAGLLGSGIMGLFNLSLTGDLTGGLSLVAGGGYFRVAGRYARSPIVAIAGDRNQFYGGAGLAYTF